MNRIVPFVFCAVILTVAARTQSSCLPADMSVSRSIKTKLMDEKTRSAMQIQQAATDSINAR